MASRSCRRGAPCRVDVLELLVPATVAASETRRDILDIELFAEEERSMGRAVEKRRREFITGRACARRALEQLGVGPTPIPSGRHGEPLWPPGIVGSITHCSGYRACAVARIEDVASLGIDAEVNAPLPEGVLEQVAFGPERELAGVDRGLHLDRLVFSAKEAIYKAWFPLAGRWLGFEDVELSLDAEARTFRAQLLVSGPSVNGVPLTAFRGAWSVENGVVCSAVLVPESPAS
jgi:4'-phosphopantetheinyl transferase EntD